jgi:phosphoserine phosphatase RsbU/P
MFAVPPANAKLRAHALAYAALAALFIFSVAHFARDAADRIDAVRHAAEYVRDPFGFGDANWGAIELQPEAESAGLERGDKVLAVNGRPVDGFVVYYGALRRARAGDRMQIQVRSPGETAIRDLSIELRPFLENRIVSTGSSAYVELALSVVAMPAICLALGFWVAAVRVGDRAAWLLLVLLLSLAAFIGGSRGYQGLYGREDLLQPLFTAYHVFFANIASTALALFAIAFPERLAVDRRLPWLKWVVLGPLVLLVAGSAILLGLQVRHLEIAQEVLRVLETLPAVGDPLQLIALGMCFASLAYKTVTASSADARRRLLLLDLGAVASVAALASVLAAIRNQVTLPAWASYLLLTMVFAFPVTMAYVIVVHRAMDVRVAIRQGLQYVLARGGIRAIQLALTVAVSIGATSILSRGAGVVRVTLVVAGLIAIVAIGGRFADRLRAWVDRRFFREAYEADAILSDLAAKVRTMVEIGPLLETVAHRIAESLHVPRIAILLNQSGTFELAYALGYPSPPRASIPERSVTMTRLRKQHAIVELDAADSWARETVGEERASLEQLGSELLLPLSLNDRVLGIMSLGPKRSEEPFSRTDIRLLDSVAAQTGLALENGRLMEAIKAEVAVREKHARELEIAHDVQERLFPQDCPPIGGLDYAGACRPALGVGGDYYDFIPLSPTVLGIAIGDVSGKGIPAALLMATLRAYLRGQTTLRQADLTRVMENLNRLVYESSAANRYATFFYGELDVGAREITYVNAGHNPPMLFRQNDGGRDVVRLDAGGPVIGLMEDCVYAEGRVALEPGDVLVAYTDGISEAMNASDDEWGEEQLMEAVRPNRRVAARALIDRLMRDADAFVAGAPQHDDMTIVVVRAT